MGDKNFRLPVDVRPSRYQFRLAPDLGRAPSAAPAPSR